MALIIASTGLHAVAAEDDPLLLMFASDHVIENLRACHDALKLSIDYALNEKLATFWYCAYRL